jgi:DNA polymerase elongation subunit (family B)
MLPNLLIFDIETAPYPTEKILEDAEPFNPESVKIGNTKDPEKIAAAKIAAGHKYLNDLVDKAALNATTGTVLCIGLYDLRSDAYLVLEGQEKEIISQFWAALEDETYHSGRVKTFVGFNILRFDLPFLMRRSWHHDIPIPVWLYEGRFLSSKFVDLMQIWQCGDRQEWISLDKISRFLLREGKAQDGKNFHTLYGENREVAIEYVKHDLLLTSRLALKLVL